MKNKLQRLYDSEINFMLSCFWDGGIDWKLGDLQNGFQDGGNEDTVEQAIEALWFAACIAYPQCETLYHSKSEMKRLQTQLGIK